MRHARSKRTLIDAAWAIRAMLLQSSIRLRCEWRVLNLVRLRLKEQGGALQTALKVTI